MNVDEVVREITRRAWSFGVAVLLSPKDYVMADKLRCSGYFDAEADPPTLAVATGLPQDRWLGILLHEYCHVTQWVEGTPLWLADDFAEWSDWLDGKPVRNVRKQLAISRDMEAECERRAIRLARELDAPINLDHYVRAANAYIHFYNTIAATRKWFAKDKAPYNTPSVLALCNSTFDKDFSKTPKALAAALLECIKP